MPEIRAAFSLVSLLLTYVDSITQMGRRESLAFLWLVIATPHPGEVHKGLPSAICLRVRSLTDTMKQGRPQAYVQRLGV